MPYPAVQQLCRVYHSEFKLQPSRREGASYVTRVETKEIVMPICKEDPDTECRGLVNGTWNTWQSTIKMSTMQRSSTSLHDDGTSINPHIFLARASERSLRASIASKRWKSVSILRIA